MGLSIDPDALEGIPRQDAQRVLDKIQWLWDNRLAVTHLPLSANLAGYYKRRLGKYRIIYSYEPNPGDMVVRLVGTRDEIYDQAG